MEFGGQGKLSALKGGAALKQLDGRFLLAGRCGIYMGLGLIMACARVLENGAPFGMAMVACSGAGISGVFALTGAALGYLVSGGIEWGIRYIAAAVRAGRRLRKHTERLTPATPCLFSAESSPPTAKSIWKLRRKFPKSSSK